MTDPRSNASNTNCSAADDTHILYPNSVPTTMPAVAPLPSSAPVPALPPRPTMGPSSYGYGNGYSYGGMGNMYGMNGMNSYGGYGGYGNYGYGMGGYGMGMGGMGAMGGLGMGMSYGGYNPMHGDIESRFIQIAEESSRPAFESIQSVVFGVGSVAMMLENTFFALTSSFRAILGVAENFGRLRSVFAQIWSSFAVFRSLNWLIRKLLVMLGIRTDDEFKAWWAQAVESTNGTEKPPSNSSWPVLLFFGVIAAAPYIVLRMLSSVGARINEKLSDPKTWRNPLRAVVQHNLQSTSPDTLSITADQIIEVAPQHLQGNMWNSGWLMATIDKQTAGMVPANYIKLIRPSSNGQASNGQTNGQVRSNGQVKDSDPDSLDQFYREL